MTRARIAVLMDQNTSTGGTRYEAIELPAHRFAIGLQWRQELLGAAHPGQAIFSEFVRAAG